jgi:lipopolysaccharide/colanic/teichoic acid biosynthesis glycosyltransferase
MMLKRIFDLFFAFFAIILLLPLFFFIGIFIIVDSRGGVFYVQKRVGKNGVDFNLYKFRTMKPDSDKKGLLTVGAKDNRITKTGYFLRKFKIDELPQLFNVFKGDMSFVGPRPEVKKYVELYNEVQKMVLSVRPGITDNASLMYIDENTILGKSENPEKTYIEEIMPNKLSLNLEYIEEISLLTDLKIIFKTIFKIFR